MGYYKEATICENGHVLSRWVVEDAKFCKKCGSPTITICQKCLTKIRGLYHEPGIFITSEVYDRPSYCHECGSSYPWTDKILENAVELLSLDDNLSDDVKSLIKGAFPDLLVETPATELAVAKYKTFVPKAAETVQNGLKNIFVDVVSEAVKKSIWG